MLHKALIIDDQPHMALIVRYALARAGFECFCCPEPTEGVRCCEEWNPHLVVLDLIMPRLDGMSVLRDLKASPKAQGIPVLVVTAKAHPQCREDALHAGAAAFLAKPFSPAALRHEARQLVAGLRDAA